MGADKRKFPRERKRAKVVMGTSPVFTVDLSAGGFCAETAHVLAPGSQVSGNLTYHGKMFEFSGKIAWAKEGDIRLGLRGRMGIQFTGISPEFYSVFNMLKAKV